MRTDQSMARVLAENGLKLSRARLQELVKKKQRRALLDLARYGQIAPGSPELIRALAKKYRLALASSASLATVGLFLERCGYGRLFEFSIDGSQIKKAKPSPEIYQLASAKLRLLPRVCLVIEDALRGVEAARAAGMSVIALAPQSRREQFIGAGATAVISSLKSLRPLLLVS